MRIWKGEQRTDSWLMLKKGRIGGTRFGQVISGKKNSLVYELVNERLSEYPIDDTFVSEAMIFGNENEKYAVKAYSKISKIRFKSVGAILSDYSDIHLASPDGLNRKRGIVIEVKCTQNGSVQIKRHIEGIDKDHIPQIINYFTVSDDVKEVHWVSFCPFRQERPVVFRIIRREDYALEIEAGRNKIIEIEKMVNETEQLFKF
jgi:hypothetical protein